MLEFENIAKVKLDFMNEEHEVAFKDANALEKLVNSARDDRMLVESQINDRLAKMLADTKRHFARENEIMDQYSFPATVHHQAEHERVLAWMEEELEAWAADGDLDRLQRFACQQFPQWLVNHIVTMDTATASYINSHGGDAL